MQVAGYFVDRAGVLGKLERTAGGGARIPCSMTEAKVMAYDAQVMKRQGYDVPPALLAKGSVRIYTPPEVIQAALPSLDAAPVTREHPGKMVDPTTYQKHVRGTVTKYAMDGAVARGEIVVNDAQLLGDIELGSKREVSLGYKSWTAFEPGVAPDGTAYDAVRTRIEYNHLAVVETARAGSQICLALDSADIPSQETEIMLKIKGVEYSADKAQAAVDSLEGEHAAMVAELAKLKGQLKEANDSLEVARAPETIAKAVEAKIAADKEAKDAADAAEAAAKVLKTKREAVAKAYPTISLEGKSADFIDGLHARLEADVAAETAGLAAVAGRGKAKEGTAQDSAQKPAKKLSAREKMIAENKKRSNGK